MKPTTLLASMNVVALVYGLPEYAKRDGNQTWVPQEWIAPGPDDSELTDKTCDIEDNTHR
jgi:hypothetical protein